MRLLTLIFVLILSACGGDGGGSSDQQQQQNDSTDGGSESLELVYDSELSGDERAALDKSTRNMKNYDINGAEIRRFNDVFGGGSSSKVVNYFETRVNYALSAATDLNSRIVTGLTSSMQREEPQILATNPSSALWYLAKVNEPERVRFEVNGKPLTIDSSRIGVMQFGEPFSGLDSILQVTALVHEARHSDCTGGALASDLERFKNNQPPLNHKCGHTHVLCPAGHPYEGSYACDEHPWGAYVVGALYAGAVALTCSNCSEEEKTVAESISLDSLQRPLYDVNKLLDGGFGPADMSSSNQVRQD